ncbi:hypothetical protein ACGFRG_14470 [Streptomyces sp. NPDC048696]|uniref:hypothetical protein n=1 Tax=Streptomyces sp. NPDC048696 TaxID=3365585 RepID=UPI00371C6A2A
MCSAHVSTAAESMGMLMPQARHSSRLIRSRAQPVRASSAAGHCYVTNAYANKWIYVRIAGTNTEGWVVGDKSTLDGGTLARC